MGNTRLVSWQNHSGAVPEWQGLAQDFSSFKDVGLPLPHCFLVSPISSLSSLPLPITKSCPIHRTTLKLTSPGPAEAKPQDSHFGGLEPRWQGERRVNKWGDSVLNSGLQRVWGARAPWLPSAVHCIALLCRESLERNRVAQNFSGSLPQHASLQSQSFPELAPYAEDHCCEGCWRTTQAA